MLNSVYHKVKEDLSKWFNTNLHKSRKKRDAVLREYGLSNNNKNMNDLKSSSQLITAFLIKYSLNKRRFDAA